MHVASGNVALPEVLDGPWDRADRYRMLVLRESPRSTVEVERVRGEHAALVEQVAAGDAEAAAGTMRTHERRSPGRRAVDTGG